MVNLHIPIQNPKVLEFWQSRAQAHGITIEKEVEELLSRAANKDYIKEKLSGLRAEIEEKCGILPDSTKIIREERDS